MSFVFQFAAPATELKVSRGAAALTLTNALIAGCAREPWPAALGAARRRGGLTVWHGEQQVWGVALADVQRHGFEQAAQALYRELFQATASLCVQRIWNFIPRINDRERGLENYQAFCQGRFQALQDHFGAGSEAMPAATAVGTGGDTLCAVFVAGHEPVHHVENPHQVPAHRYPRRYGPRPPSFARGSLLQSAAGACLYVSGTASIRGSESLHQGDLPAQLALALDNADAVARAAGVEDGLGPDSAGERRFRLYLRCPDHWPAARAVLQRALLRDGDELTVVQADICRRELLVEIEATIRRPGLAQAGRAAR